MRQFHSSIPWLNYLLFTLHNQGYPWLCKTRFRLMVSLYRVGVEPTGFQRMISVHRTSHILRLSLSQERPDTDSARRSQRQLLACLLLHLARPFTECRTISARGVADHLPLTDPLRRFISVRKYGCPSFPSNRTA